MIRIITVVRFADGFPLSIVDAPLFDAQRDCSKPRGRSDVAVQLRSGSGFEGTRAYLAGYI